MPDPQQTSPAPAAPVAAVVVERRVDLAGIVALVALIFSIIAGAGSLYVGIYRIGQLEDWKKEHVAEDKATQEKLETTKSSHDTRITVLEDRYATILVTLDSINKKLDAAVQPPREGRGR